MVRALPDPAGCRRWRPLLAALLIAGLAPWARANPQAIFPSRDSFRALQLAAQDCGRDNDPASCDRARTGADTLLDHPRLPARCKDTLWEISQQARVAPRNDLARREALNRSGADLLAFCRQQVRTPQPEAPGGPQAPTGGGTRPAPVNPPGLGSGGLL
ncbi:MAG: hypothetical protein VKN13_09010 [Cyanobacteriota bacterium]|nr:hypothetical protein [Cyanobacteriota bacterium]